MGTKAIKWNFTKFLINRQGEVVRRYAPTTKPEELLTDVETELAQA
jgi:glutathione peroxidase